MSNPRNRRRDPRAPAHIAYAAYLFPTPAAFRMHLRGLSFPNLRDWAEQAAKLPGWQRRALEEELDYRSARPYMHAGGKSE
ncbi:hypothetical protein [Deinococcus sp. SL84]|uniref:hypothetical protein n=1 Tax=Deinococcus sp. SL84 TaxID=2994663 RepID=UPI0022755A59|nr:hypothetical protein [Deinococcus sp. SL84]MCY1703653.1 hypothetical protein [Deinococcus sp. SL84]